MAVFSISKLVALVVLLLVKDIQADKQITDTANEPKVEELESSENPKIDFNDAGITKLLPRVLEQYTYFLETDYVPIIISKEGTFFNYGRQKLYDMKIKFGASNCTKGIKENCAPKSNQLDEEVNECYVKVVYEREKNDGSITIKTENQNYVMKRFTNMMKTFSKEGQKHFENLKSNLISIEETIRYSDKAQQLTIIFNFDNISNNYISVMRTVPEDISTMTKSNEITEEHDCEKLMPLVFEQNSWFLEKGYASTMTEYDEFRRYNTLCSTNIKFGATNESLNERKVSISHEPLREYLNTIIMSYNYDYNKKKVTNIMKTFSNKGQKYFEIIKPHLYKIEESIRYRHNTQNVEFKYLFLLT